MPGDSPQYDDDSLLAHAEGVRRLVRGLVRSDQVDDVVQETMLVLVSGRGPTSSSTGAWLAGVARNIVGKLMRTETRRLAREARAVRGEGLAPGDDVAQRLEEERLVVQCMRELEEPFRTVVYLRYYDGLPPRRIARHLGIPVETAKSRLKRGLARLRSRLDANHGGDGRTWRACLVPLLFAVPPRPTGTDARPLARPLSRIGAGAGAAVVLTALVVGLWLAGSTPETVPTQAPGPPPDPAGPHSAASGDRTADATHGQSRKDDESMAEARTTKVSKDPDESPPAVRADPRVPAVRRPGGVSSGGATPTGLRERFLSELPRGPATLLVTVRDRDGTPVPGATVYLGTPDAAGHREAPLSWFHRLGETGVNGALRCVGLPEGAATVAADLGRLLSIQGSRALDAGHGVRIALRDGDGTTVEVRLPFSLSELGTIRGRVTAPAGFPHHLLRVAVGLHGVTPDAAGGFELPWIPSGASVLRATASSLRPHQRVVEVEAGKATEVTVALGFAETGSLELRGTVVGPQGEPLPGAGVLLFARHRPGRATSRSILADEHGRFVFETLPDELASVEIRLSANLRGYRSTQKVLPTGPVTGEVELRLPQRLVRVTIVARDASDSEPLTRCRFVARRTGAGRLSVQFTRRALDGRYEVWLDPGEHEFVVEAPDYTTHRATVDVGQAGGEFTYEASLVPDRPTGPEVRLVVVLTAEDTAGPVERAKVEVLREHGVEPRVSIDGHRAGGEFVLPVPASTWILRVTAAGFETSEETIRLDPGKKSHRIEIALRRK